MISLSDSQLEIIICEAESMAEKSCGDFLERVATILQVRGQIDDADVSMAVRQALRELIHNSDVWKDWKRNTLPMLEDEQRPEAQFSRTQPAANRSRALRWLRYLSKPFFSSSPAPAH